MPDPCVSYRIFLRDHRSSLKKLRFLSMKAKQRRAHLVCNSFPKTRNFTFICNNYCSNTIEDCKRQGAQETLLFSKSPENFCLLLFHLMFLRNLRSASCFSYALKPAGNLLWGETATDGPSNWEQEIVLHRNIPLFVIRVPRSERNISTNTIKSTQGSFTFPHETTIAGRLHNTELSQ